MTVQPFIEASFTIQFHAVVASLALGLGPIAIYRMGPLHLHKPLGYIWAAAMIGAAVSSFFIPSFMTQFGYLGPIHALSVFAIFGVIRGVRAAINRDFAAHQRIMKSVYFYGVFIAAAFNFLPHRMINEMLLEHAPNRGIWVMAVMVVLLTLRGLHQLRRDQSPV